MEAQYIRCLSTHNHIFSKLVIKVFGLLVYSVVFLCFLHSVLLRAIITESDKNYFDLSRLYFRVNKVQCEK